MPSGSEEYHGYTIPWDTKQDPNKTVWTGTAAVMSPPDFAGIPRIVYGITAPANGFQTEAEAQDYLIRTAKEWIDRRSP
jgi:hypothetical protein